MTAVVDERSGQQPAEVGRTVLELQDVSRVYSSVAEEVRALDTVNCAVDAGDYVAVVGPSGSGKSTLMHILGCLDVPTSGTYLLAGEDVGRMAEEALAGVRNRRIGFVFQQFHLLSAMTAAGNVELPLIYAGVPRAERRARAYAALAQVGLADRTEHRPNQLSGGQQQRVAVARALVTEPAIVLADEPTGNLDSNSTRDILALFDDLNRLGRTIVLITHEPDVAQRARRVLTISDGRITSDVRADDGTGS